MKFHGYLDVRMLKLRAVPMGTAPAGMNYRFAITYESEELRQKWVASDIHQESGEAWKRRCRLRDYTVLLFDVYVVSAAPEVNDEENVFAVASALALIAGVSLAHSRRRRARSADAAARRADRAHRAVEVSPLAERARRPGAAELHGSLQRDVARHEPVFPASRHHPAEERHRRAFSQPVRRDVRHLRRRSAVHDRRPHVAC